MITQDTITGLTLTISDQRIRIANLEQQNMALRMRIEELEKGEASPEDKARQADEDFPLEPVMANGKDKRRK